MPRPIHILVGATGSVASIKLFEITTLLVEAFSPRTVEIKVVVTQNAKHFFNQDLLAASGVVVLTDEDEWAAWRKIPDPVLHIDLRHWADTFLVAPLDANTLGKIAGGLCDNLLTCTLRAWNMTKPVLLAPAMNTHMWEHPLTERHLRVVEELGYHIIQPVAKRLACGDIGIGALATPVDIAKATALHLKDMDFE